MEWLTVAVQVLLIVLVPWLSLRFPKRYAISQFLSPVILCYAAGMLIANFNLLPVNEEVAHAFNSGTIAMAIPMLLYSTDLRQWVRYARSTIVSFLVCIACGLLSSLLVAAFWGDRLEGSWQYAGMIAGVYTGGIPNVQAIGLAIQAPKESLVLVYAADIFCGGIYLLFLTSVAAKIFARFLPAFQYNNALTNEDNPQSELEEWSWQGALRAISYTLLVVVASVGLSLLFTGKMNDTLIILLLTTFSVLSSFFSFTDTFRGAYLTGEYFLLMFCVAVGMLSDFGTIWVEGGAVILFMGAILGLTVVLHLFVCYLLKIDRDTVMITATAALYGPAFIGQIASVLRNRTLVFSGMATSLVGLALGNYVGVGIANLLRWWLG